MAVLIGGAVVDCAVTPAGSRVQVADDIVGTADVRLLALVPGRAGYGADLLVGPPPAGEAQSAAAVIGAGIAEHAIAGAGAGVGAGVHVDVYVSIVEWCRVGIIGVVAPAVVVPTSPGQGYAHGYAHGQRSRNRASNT